MTRPNFTTANPEGWRIASVEHTRSGARWIDWYAPHNAGYEEDLDRAGVYDLKALLADAWNYQRSGLIIVPDYVARRLAPTGLAPNNVATWTALYLVGLFRGLARPAWPKPWDEKKFRRELKSSVETYRRLFPVKTRVRVDSRHGTVDDVIVEAAKLSGENVVVRVARCGRVKCIHVSTPPDPLDDLTWDVARALRGKLVGAVVAYHLQRRNPRGWVYHYA